MIVAPAGGTGPGRADAARGQACLRRQPCLPFAPAGLFMAEASAPVSRKTGFRLRIVAPCAVKDTPQRELRAPAGAGHICHVFPTHENCIPVCAGRTGTCNIYQRKADTVPFVQEDDVVVRINQTPAGRPEKDGETE